MPSSLWGIAARAAAAAVVCLLGACSQVSQDVSLDSSDERVRSLLGTATRSWEIPVSLQTSGAVPHGRIGVPAAAETFPKAAQVSSASDAYTVELRDADDQRVRSTTVSFERGAACQGAPPRPGDSEQSFSRDASEWVQRLVTLPIDEAARTIVLVNAAGSVLARRSLPPVPTAFARAAFTWVGAEENLRRAAGTNGISVRYEVAVIGHGYASSTALAQDFATFRAELLRFPAFSSLLNRISFYVETATGSLGCYYEGRVIWCDDAQVRARANRAGRFDHILVFSNTNTYGGAAHWGASGVPRNGNRGMNDGAFAAISARHSDFARIAVHEFGHLLGLHDEYTYDAAGQEYWRTVTSSYGPNCVASLPTTSVGWGGYGPKAGCVRDAWFRPDDSIMRFLASAWHNTPSSLQIQRAITNRSTGYVANKPRSTIILGDLQIQSRNEFPAAFLTASFPVQITYCAQANNIVGSYGAAAGNSHRAYFDSVCDDWIAVYSDPLASIAADGTVTVWNHVPLHFLGLQIPFRVLSCANPSLQTSWGVTTGASHEAYFNWACSGSYAAQFRDPRLPAPTFPGSGYRVVSYNSFPTNMLDRYFSTSIVYCRNNPSLVRAWGAATGRAHYAYFKWACGDFWADSDNLNFRNLGNGRIEVTDDVPTSWRGVTRIIRITRCAADPSKEINWGAATLANHEAYFDWACGSWTGNFPQ